MSRLLGGACLLSLALLAPTAAAAQDGDFPTQDPVIEAMWNLGMVEENSQIAWLAQTLLDSIGPRLSGSSGQRDAIDWAQMVIRGWGVDVEAQQYGTWAGWERGISHIDLIEPRVRSLNGMMLAFSQPTDGPVEAEVVALPNFVSAAEYQSWLSTIDGKIVAWSAPEPTCRAPESWEALATPESWEAMQELQRATGQARAEGLRNTGSEDVMADIEAAGAVAILQGNWSDGWGANKVFGSPAETIPGAQLSCEDYGLVFRLAANDQGPRVRLNLEAEFQGQQPVYNVIATLPGTELPDEYVLLTAHFDSHDGASGATDNGSGTVMMMEAMRLLKETYPNPRRTIVLALWGGEEQGLIGSNAFAEDNPDVVEGLQAAFNQDNGTWRIDFIRMQGFTGAGSHFGRWLSAVPDEITRHIELDIPGEPERGGSDHMAFICRLAPGFRLQSHYPDYRQYTWHTDIDTYDKLILADLRNNATLAAMLAYGASEDPERMETMPRGDIRYGGCNTARRSGGG